MTNYRDIRTLRIDFNLPLKSKDIGKFRGAVISTAGQDNDLFHNHKGNKTIYRYPKIQYKTIQRKATLVCIEEGIEALQEFFGRTDWQLWLGQNHFRLQVERIKAHSYKVGLWAYWFEYQINDWLALNQENYQRYRNCASLGERIAILEKILLANLLSFLQGIDLYVSEQIKVEITNLHPERIRHYKGQKMQAFNLDFRTNLSLPNFIGLGKGSSVGFGVVKEIKKSIQ